MDPFQAFFAWQNRALGWLMVWGAASTIVGAALARARTPLPRHAGYQALGWGMIDLLLAVRGRQSARRQAQHAGRDQALRAARRFHAVLAVNCLLDVGYCLGGAWLARSVSGRVDRHGTGLGILPQGGFLLAYDLLLLRAVRRWLDEHDTAS